MSVAKEILYKKNSQYVELALKDQSVTPVAYVNTATLLATLKDLAGQAVAGFTNVAGQYQTASNGVYRFPVDPNTFDPPVDSTYTLVIDGTAGTKRYEVEHPMKVVVRNAGTEI